jgi:beta-phosphoglucomutase-like phosphatase (HAD superfamily)
LAGKWDLVIFDCDGVLVDSEPISNGALVEMLGEIGLTLSLDESAGMFRGRSMASIISIAEERMGRSVPLIFWSSITGEWTEPFRSTCSRYLE